jgi:Flp pilus assembly CpaE family ATPase
VVKRGSNSSRAGTEAPLDKSTVVAVTGGKGGVGVTTVACALAGELRRSGEAVLLADLDMHTGLVAFLMAVESQYSIMDAISASADLDLALWQRLVVQSEEGIDVICSAAMPGSAAAPPDGITQVLTAIRPFYRWIVLDLGRLNSCAPELLAAAHEHVVVTSTSIPALYETKRAIETLRIAGMGDRIRLTVNQISPETCASKDLHSIFGLDVAAVLPSSGRELYEACVQRRIPGGSIAFGKEMAKLVQTIGGSGSAPSPSPTRGKWFSRSSKSPAQAAVK